MASNARIHMMKGDVSNSMLKEAGQYSKPLTRLFAQFTSDSKSLAQMERTQKQRLSSPSLVVLIPQVKYKCKPASFALRLGILVGTRLKPAHSYCRNVMFQLQVTIDTPHFPFPETNGRISILSLEALIARENHIRSFSFWEALLRKLPRYTEIQADRSTAVTMRE